MRVMDHSQAAPALLGSSLLLAAKASDESRPAPASSGSAVIDDKTLEGGFRYGEITSIAGNSGTAKTLITYHAIASHLLANDFGEAAIIDTVGSFSPTKLRDVLTFRLETQSQRQEYQQTGYVHEKAPFSQGKGDRDPADRAISMLDRVKVMRVFDLAGVVEAVGELSEMREKSILHSIRNENDTMGVDQKRKEVVDSEEENDDSNDDDPQGKPSPEPAMMAEGTVGMIVIDTITTVTSSVMQKSQTQGQALLVSFIRFLHHLTARLHICTILVNAVVGINSSNNRQYQARPAEHVSIFSTTLGKPALGKTFAYLVHTSIYLSTVPKTSDDATLAFGDNSELPSSKKALIIEVLKDRCGSREGRWAAFEVVAGVKLVPFLG